MERLKSILKELGISKVKLAKYLGVSRQMIYNYLDLDDLNKWSKDKRVLLFNLLGIKTAEELYDIKVSTDYIMDVETRINNLFLSNNNLEINVNNDIYEGLNPKQVEVLHSIIEFTKDLFEDDNNQTGYHTALYLNHFLQAMDMNKELKYILGYFSKAAGFTKPMDFTFDEEKQFIFESILFSALTLYNSESTVSKSKIAEAHKRFVDHIEQKREEKLSRTLELNSAKVQALKELNYSEITEKNAAEVLEKIAEIQSRNVLS